MNIIKVAVKRPITTLMLLLIVIVFGALSFMNIKLDMMPNMNIPIAVVFTTYNGAGPEEIETLITDPLEGALATVTGVTDITSTSSYGSSIIIVQFEDNIDLNFASLDMRERIDLVKGMLPEDASSPTVMKIDMNSMTSLSLGVTSSTMNLTELQTLLDSKIVNRIERQAGVASVSLSGGKEKEVSIILNQDSMRSYGIAESTVSGILRSENLNVPVGSVQRGDQTLNMSVVGEFKSLNDIRNLAIPTAAGSTVYLRDIATIDEVYKDQSSINYINASPAINLTIQKQSDANTVEVSEAVMKEVARIQNEYPDLTIVTLVDPADYINLSIGNVSSSALYGGLFAIIILLLFLGDVRATIVVAVAMPVSIIATFLLMNLQGLTLNMMSLGGLALGVGMLVDNSIVVLESIYRKIEDGQDKQTAAIKGAQEVMLPVIASTLTTIAVFLPISFAGGMVAEVFNEFTFTITFALVSSLVVALTFVPMASALLLKPTSERSNRKNIITIISDVFNKGFAKVEAGYKNLLGFALEKRKTVYMVVLAFIVLTGMSLSFIGFTLMPETDESLVTVSISMPTGTVLDETMVTTEQIVEIVQGIDEVETVTMSIGVSTDGISGSSSDRANLNLLLKPVADRDRTSQEVAMQVADMVKDIPGAEITVSASAVAMGSFGGGSVDMYIYADDSDTMNQIIADFTVMAANIPGTGVATSSISDGTPQARIKIDRDKASSLGVTPSSVSSIVNTAVNGSVATTYKIDGTEYDVRIRQNSDNFDYINDISNILIPSAYGNSVPLYEIATVVIEDIPASINHENQLRYASISIPVGTLSTSDVKNGMEEQISHYIMPTNTSWKYSGSAEQMNEMFGSLGMALIGALFLVYMVMAAQFESFLYPLIVMFAIPIAMTGGVFGLFVFGELFSITAFMGLIMLSGLVINNAIVLIDYTNFLIREEHMSVDEALAVAGPVRLRPIVMSTLTTVLGLVPMLISQAAGSEMMKGLAAVVIFGLLFSTLVTLVLIPTIYKTVNTSRNKRLARKEARIDKKQADGKIEEVQKIEEIEEVEEETIKEIEDVKDKITGEDKE